MTKYRQLLLAAHGQISALLQDERCFGIPDTEEEKTAIRETFDMLQESISLARMEVPK